MYVELGLVPSSLEIVKWYLKPPLNTVNNEGEPLPLGGAAVST